MLEAWTPAKAETGFRLGKSSMKLSIIKEEAKSEWTLLAADAVNVIYRNNHYIVKSYVKRLSEILGWGVQMSGWRQGTANASQPGFIVCVSAIWPWSKFDFPAALLLPCNRVLTVMLLDEELLCQSKKEEYWGSLTFYWERGGNRSCASVVACGNCTKNRGIVIVTCLLNFCHAFLKLLLLKAL